jgi:subtilisin family serine protease
LQVQNIPAGSAPSQVCGSQVGGDLQLQSTGSAVQIGSISGSCWGNSIVHNLVVQNNTGSIQVVGNAVGAALQCQNNSSVVEGPNAAPQQQGQCSAAPSYAAILEIADGADIKAIASALQAQVVNQLPQSGTYLLSVRSLAPTAYSTPGVLLIEINLSKSLGSPKGGILQTSNTTGPNWYLGQPAFKLIEADRALSLSSGSGVIIADLDSMVDHSHPALAGHLTAGYDFVTGNPVGSTVLNQSAATFLDQSSATFLDQSSATFLDQSSATFLDQSSATFLDQSSATFLDSTNPFHGHGTLVAGILSAIAPQSMIMPLRVFDDSGNADTYTIATAIRYAVDHGAHVINMSFSTTDDSKALKDALDYANKAGVVLVASAGNDNSSQPVLPASAGNVIGVAATDLTDMKASFSNYGGYLQVSAPGVNIIAPYPSGHYALVSGTSFSAPIVAGEAALIRSFYLGTINVEDKVGKGTINIGQKNPGKSLGHGRIDVLHGLTLQ